MEIQISPILHLSIDRRDSKGGLLLQYWPLFLVIYDGREAQVPDLWHSTVSHFIDV